LFDNLKKINRKDLSRIEKYRKIGYTIDSFVNIVRRII